MRGSDRMKMSQEVIDNISMAKCCIECEYCKVYPETIFCLKSGKKCKHTVLTHEFILNRRRNDCPLTKKEE